MSNDGAPEGSVDIDLRSPDAIARRCIILATIVRRFSIDATRQDNAYGAVFDLREWLRTENVWQEATHDERKFLREPADRPTTNGGLEVAFVAEGLATIAWALGLLQSLSDDRLASLVSLMQDIPSPWDATAPWIEAQTLRPEAEVAQMRELHEIWTWRLETERDRRSARGRDLLEIENLIEEVTNEAFAAGLLSPGDTGGFTLAGVAVTAMAPSKIAEQQLLTQERLIALNWLCGYGDDWDNVPINV